MLAPAEKHCRNVDDIALAVLAAMIGLPRLLALDGYCGETASLGLFGCPLVLGGDERPLLPSMQSG